MPYLDPYSGTWSASQARHLLKRTTFGVTEKAVSQVVTLGLSNTIDKLFENKSLPEPPLKYIPDGTGQNEVNDPDAAYGETWINGTPWPTTGSNQESARVVFARKRSFYAWSFLQMMDSGINIREKLTLFWHNHFVSIHDNPHREYFYANILRSNALGNFKQMTKEITLDPNMLQYLSGAYNTRWAPNENYSRELLELFTVGKGPHVGNGDYTNYTEDDVVEMAKALTGWRIYGLNDEKALDSEFIQNRYAGGSKQLSHRFGNKVIAENGNQEYSDLIDIIFEQDECSRFIIRQLYIWFVNHNISTTIEDNIVEPLAKIVRDNNYDIAPALKVLLASDHFFENVFCMVKSPIDLLLSTTQSLLLKAPTSSVNEQYDFAYVIFLICSELEQSVYNHPDVAGWKAYYQEPLYYKTWINNYLLPKRLDYCKALVAGGQISIGQASWTIPPLVPVLEVVAEINDAHEPNLLIHELANRMFNYSISQGQVTDLKEILIPGLPDFEWTVEYLQYLDDPSDVGLRNSVQNKLRNLIGTMVQMSEFQIM